MHVLISTHFLVRFPAQEGSRGDRANPPEVLTPAGSEGFIWYIVPPSEASPPRLSRPFLSP